MSCPKVWAILDIILVKLIDAFNLSKSNITTEENIIPNELIQNGVPKIVPFIRFPNVKRRRITRPISLAPSVFKATKDTILASPNLIPKAIGGINKFSIKLMTIAKEHKIAMYAYLLFLFIDHHHKTIWKAHDWNRVVR